ncbi:hypothetical protein KL936_004341 [Ogataea polymorpha]|nr:hypothetical protein KL936_004341 [Ogataea polymorpha]
MCERHHLVLRTDQGDQKHVCEHSSDENDHHGSVVKHLRRVLAVDREMLAHGGLDGRRGRRRKVTELISDTDNKRTEVWRSKLRQMDWNDTPGALDAKLQEKGPGVDSSAFDERPRVQQCGTADAADEDRETSADEVGEVADDNTAHKSADVGHAVRHSGPVVRIVVQLRQHRRIQVLGAVGHEVEAGHEQHKIDDHGPVVLESAGGLLRERWLRNATISVILLNFSLAHKRLGVWERESESEQTHRNRATQQKQRLPAHVDVVCEHSGEHHGQKIAERVALLQQSGNKASGLGWTVIERGGSGVSVDSTQHDAKDGSHAKKLLVGADSVGAELDGGHEQDVDTERVFSAVSVAEVAEHNPPHGSQHEHERDPPRNLFHGLVKVCGKFSSVQGNTEKVVRVPGPGQKSRQKHNPLPSRDEFETRQRVQEVFVGLHHRLRWHKVGEPCLGIVGNGFCREVDTLHLVVHTHSLVVIFLYRERFQITHYEIKVAKLFCETPALYLPRWPRRYDKLPAWVADF